MNLYISDTHFGHKNVIRFDHRPFFNIEEMDYTLIKLWNSRVQRDDQVYIIGDFACVSYKSSDWYLKQLKGHKHLIIGNHDKVTLDNPQAIKYLESVEQMKYVVDDEKNICLCHYPLTEWYESSQGSWHIYGHIHASTDETYKFMKSRKHALNAAACINNYTPSSINELIRNNSIFQKDH